MQGRVEECQVVVVVVVVGSSWQLGTFSKTDGSRTSTHGQQTLALAHGKGGGGGDKGVI